MLTIVGPSGTVVDDAAVQTKAARVGADVLAEYQRLAARLRQRGWDEAAAIAHAADPTAQAAHRCAFELYETAAAELDDLVADLFDGAERPPEKISRTPTLRVVGGGQAKRSLN